ncbi:MAG: hypothetical protein U1B83_09400, partial [Candidatus Cloacimonadaceae bacterium]|nr:hypothetical protein [Candidatus Cloacimonadaceae bacterium]
MPKIINALDYPPGLEPAVRYIHDKWGSEENYDFYYDAISHSSPSPTGLPRFYLLIEQERVIGCYALLTNDLIS